MLPEIVKGPSPPDILFKDQIGVVNFLDKNYAQIRFTPGNDSYLAQRDKTQFITDYKKIPGEIKAHNRKVIFDVVKDGDEYRAINVKMYYEKCKKI